MDQQNQTNYQNQFNQQNPQYQYQQYNQTMNIPEEYQPISMWGYFGYEILFSIPCIGWILLIVFAFGGTRNVNLRNFARSYFCFLIVALILIAILYLVGSVSSLSYY